ncbi:MAG: hypothetical protein GY926_10760 [bacterium]|nr:hypothetical protein [bacterium]
MKINLRFGRLTLLGKISLLMADVIVVASLAVLLSYRHRDALVMWTGAFWVVPIAWMVLILIGARPIVRGTAKLFGLGRTNAGDYLLVLSLLALVGGFLGGGLGFELYLHFRDDLMMLCSFPAAVGGSATASVCTPLGWFGPHLALFGAVSGAGLAWWAGLAFLERGHRRRKNVSDSSTPPVHPGLPPGF